MIFYSFRMYIHSMLSDKFYKHISSKTVVDTSHMSYTVYESLYSNPLILFSEFESTPLFAIELQYNDKSMYVNQLSLFTDISDQSLDNSSKHQAVVTKDDSEIEFVVTNFTDHHLHFNLMQNDKPINHVNILKPLETTTIRSNQINDKVLKFKTQTDNTETGTGNKITLKNKLENKNMQDTDITLIINPVTNDLLKKLFEHTVWKSVNQFVLKSIISFKLNNYEHKHVPRCPRYVVSPWSQVSFDRFPVESYANANANTQLDTYYGEIQQYDESENESENESYFNDDFDQDSEDKMAMSFNDYTGTIKSIGVNTISSVHRNMTHDIDIHNLMKSHVGSIVQGTETYKPSTQNVILDISYDVSASTRFGFVLLDGNYIVKKNCDSVEDANLLISDSMNSKYIPLIKNVYQSEDCVVCLENNTNILFYSCGHSCVCDKCSPGLDKCPLCRSRITIALNVGH
jgi:hypothetical protein